MLRRIGLATSRGAVRWASTVAATSPSITAAREHLKRIGGDGSVSLSLTDVPHLAVIRLENPKRANALSPKMMVELSDAVSELETTSDQLIGLIVMGANKTFCSGADLRSSSELFSKESGAAMQTVMIDATRRLGALPLISLAAIEGAAVGGGAELATATDFRLMYSGAFIQFVHVTRGLLPGWGGLPRLVSLCGRKQALYLTAGAIKADAELAASLHLTDTIVEPSETTSMLDHAVAFFEPFLYQEDISAGSLRALKRAIDGVSTATGVDAAYAVNAAAFLDRWGGPEAMKFVSGFNQNAPAKASGAQAAVASVNVFQ